MKITIHRGINQIGGCITEITTDRARILIDFGQNLPNNGVAEDQLATPEKVSELTKGIDAIFYTHFHGDHIGLFHLVPDDVKQYIGETAKLVTLRKHTQLGLIPDRAALTAKEIAKLEMMYTFEAGKSISKGDIRVTPYFVSHSACDSYMFLIEANDKRILHTGDFRDHGYLGKGLLSTIRKLILTKGKIDILITEGTLLTRQDKKIKSEYELQKELIHIMQHYKNVFVLCSSTDMERLATIYAANKKILNRPFVCDGFQKDILNIFTDTKGVKSLLFQFKKVYDFSPNNIKLMEWMVDKGFCMLVRATEKSNKFDDYVKHILPQLNPQKTILIYSMWSEYINPKSCYANQAHLDFISQFPNVKQLHTSGHASMECLAEVCTAVNPREAIIPIHSEKSDNYNLLSIRDELKAKITLETSVIF